MIENKINRRINPADLSEAHFSGKIEDKFQKVIFQRVTSENALKNIFQEAENAFEECLDDAEPPVGMWRGEFWGKLMISTCGCYRYTQNTAIKELIKNSTYRILSYQRPNGFLGTYKNEQHIFAADRKKGAEILGAPFNWTWNIWTRKYTLWGLLEAYLVLEDSHILDCAAASANQLIDMLHDMGARITETGTFNGLPSGSILKPMLILYKLTENTKYLDFALEIASQWEDDETYCTKIIPMSLSDVPIHHWCDSIAKIPVKSKGNPFYPQGEVAVKPECFDTPETALKVYEMQSCFEGLLELYQVTGTEKYLEATKHFYDLLIKDEFNAIFSVGFNDLFLNAGKYPTAISELCDVIHFIKLGTELFELTGDIKYLDYVELSFYNPFLAGVSRDGSWGARGIRHAEGHMQQFSQSGCKYNMCCSNNMPRGFLNVAETIVTYNRSSVYVNFFSEADVTVHPRQDEFIHVAINSGYLNNCSVTINVDTSSLHMPIKLNLRIPSWSKKTLVRWNNKSQSAENGSYFPINLSEGKMEINIDFDKTPHLINDNYYTDFYTLSNYLKSRYLKKGENVHPDTMAETNMARLCVGPILMASSIDLGSTKEVIFNHRKVCGMGCKCSVEPINTDRMLAAYNVLVEWPDGDLLKLPMGDFASISDTLEWKDYRYTIYL